MKTIIITLLLLSGCNAPHWDDTGEWPVQREVNGVKRELIYDVPDEDDDGDEYEEPLLNFNGSSFDDLESTLQWKDDCPEGCCVQGTCEDRAAQRQYDRQFFLLECEAAREGFDVHNFSVWDSAQPDEIGCT